MRNRIDTWKFSVLRGYFQVSTYFLFPFCVINDSVSRLQSGWILKVALKVASCQMLLGIINKNASLFRI